MNRTFKRRLDELEARHSPFEPRAIFITVVCKETGDPNNGWRTSIAGWRYGDTDIMREPDEYDEQLQQRALSFAREQGEQPFMMFRQISESDKEN